MQMVIDILEEEYEECKMQVELMKQEGILIESLNTALRIHVANGTPLPKGHGRLIDGEIVWDKLKELEEHYQAEFLKKSNAIHESAMNGRLYGFTNAKFIVQDAPTILESDKGE